MLNHVCVRAVTTYRYIAKSILFTPVPWCHEVVPRVGLFKTSVGVIGIVGHPVLVKGRASPRDATWTWIVGAGVNVRIDSQLVCGRAAGARTKAEAEEGDDCDQSAGHVRVPGRKRDGIRVGGGRCLVNRPESLSLPSIMSAEPFRNARGTRDLLPQDLVLVRHLERMAEKVATAASYQEIRTPLFEETRLFQRSLGETSDVVAKEMFSVPKRGTVGAEMNLADGYTFRPENTASIARAYIQGGFAKSAPLQKWFYVGPMFRYERPQKGRERQFTQFGVEAFGPQSPTLDAEVVGIALQFFRALGFDEQLEVRVNSMGDPEDRAVWSEKLREFFADQFAESGTERCADCVTRYEKNVFRLLDCKVKRCIEKNVGAPDLFSVMGDAAKQHHEDFCNALRAIGFNPVEDRSIVRGLDYYSRTVFEVHFPPLGARSALCGGGRYDGLVEEMGGKATPGVGFSVGFTPTELALKELGLPVAADLEDLNQKLRPQVYAVGIGEEDRLALFRLVTGLREAGIRCELDHRGKSAKAQFKEASKSGARFALVLGAEERAANQIVLKDLNAKEERSVGQDALLGILREALNS